MTVSTRPTPSPAPADVINQLAGIAAESRVGQLRAQRPEVLRYAEGSYQALLEPEDRSGISRAERELIALRVATLTGSAALAAWHQERLERLDIGLGVRNAVINDPQSLVLSPRERALMRHVDLVSRAPASATAADLAALVAVGLSPREIVIVSQLIAFLSFQVRTLVGLRLLTEEV